MRTAQRDPDPDPRRIIGHPLYRPPCYEDYSHGEVPECAKPGYLLSQRRPENPTNIAIPKLTRAQILAIDPDLAEIMGDPIQDPAGEAEMCGKTTVLLVMFGTPQEKESVARLAAGT